MIIKKAINSISRQFPFKNYMSGHKEVYFDLVRTAKKFLPAKARILDFGSGPMDKTAILSKLGFQCFACDDLEDEWHKKNKNRMKILKFARQNKIKFYQNKGEKLRFAKNYFDMIMLHSVLEHWHNSPKNLLTDLLSFLKHKGYIFITVPNAVNIRKRIAVVSGNTNYPSFKQYFEYPDPWRGHVREYTKDDLEQLCKFLNLRIIMLESRNYLVESRLVGISKYLYSGLTYLFPWWRDTLFLIAQKK